ncbi:phosphoglycerate kinase, partial [Candidatus Ruminimicrobium bovinum]|uniref:phosphoglycerate kinase n=1 Tax=Candidatus Ruminimicrobium bovinum TaxID=3242779 RepID=UPI0039B89D26
TVVDTIQKILTGNFNNAEYVGKAGQWFLNAHGNRYKNNLNKKAMEIGLNRVEKATAISTVAAAVVTMFVAISLFLGSGDVAAHNLVNGLDIPSTISLTDIFKYIVFALFGSNIISHSVWNIFKPGAKLDLSLGDRIKKALENMWRNHAFDFGHFAGGIEVADAIRNQLESDDYSIKIKTTFNNIEKYIENIEKDTNAERKGLDDLKKLISIKSNILDMYAATETTNFFKQIYDLTENNKTENDNVLFNYEWTTVILSGEYEQIIDNLNNLNLPEIKDDVDTLYNSLANVEESGFMAISRAIELYNEATNDTDRKFVLDALKNMQEAIENRIKDIEEGKQKVDDKKLEDLEQYLAEIKNITESETDVRFTKDSTKENRLVNSLDNYINDETNNRVLRFGASFVRELVVSTLEFKAVFDEDFLQKHSQYRKAKDAGDKETAETMEKGVKYIKYGSFGILLVSSVLSCLYIGVDAGSVHNLFNLMASMVIGIVSGVLSSIGIHAGYNLFNRNAKITKDYDELHDLLYSMDIFGEDGQTIGLTEVALNKLKEFNKYNDSNFKDFSDMASQLKEFVAGEQNIQNANKVVKIFKNLANSEIDELTTLNFIYGFVQFEKIKKLVDIYNDENASYVERENAREQLNKIKGTIDDKNIGKKIVQFKKQGFNISEDDLILQLNINTSDRVTVKSVNDDVKDSIDEFSDNLKNKVEEFYSNDTLKEKEGYQDYKNFIEKTIIPIYIESITGSRIINYLDNQIAASNIKTKEYYDGVAKKVKQIQDKWLEGKYNYGENKEELMTMLEIIDRGISKVEQGKDIYNLIEKDRKTNLLIEARDSVRQIIATETMREILLDEVSDKKLRKQIEKAKSKEELDLILANIAQTDQKTLENIVPRLDIKKSLIDINGEKLVGKTIGLVVDLNAPLDSSKTKVTDPTRIEATLRTIKYLTDRGANIVLMSHLGRPTDEKNIEKRYKDFNMEPVAKQFREFGIDVDFKKASSKKTYSEYINRVDLSIDEKTQGKVVLLDNLRFDERYSDKETKSQMADQFINKLRLDGVVFDAFGVSHRNNFSREMIQKVENKEIGAVTGFLVEKELSEFAKVENPKHPFVAILGGSKVSDKIGVIENLLDKMTAGDTIVIGGAMAYTFLKAQGIEIGKSLVEDDKLDLAIKLQKAAEEKGVNLLLPVDHVVTSGLDFGDVNNNEADKTEDINIPKDKMGADIGPKTVEKIESVLEKVGKSNGTIVWNGPSGVFEIPVFAEGTTNVAKAVAQATDDGAFSMIGGGDSVSAANKAGVSDRISHISTGGGASLNLLEGNSSPLIEVIPSKFQKEIDEVKNIIRSASKDAVEQKTQKVDQAKYSANEIVSINIKESDSKEIGKFINETADKLQQENNWSDEGTKIFKNYMFARIAQIKGDSSDELLDFESFTPTAWQKEGVNFDGVITNLDNLKDEKYIREAKSVDVGVYLMNGGIGSSIEREDYLVSINWYKEQIEKINNSKTTQQEKSKIEEQINKVFNNETSIKNILGNKYESYKSNVELAAKADDLYFQYKNEAGNTRLISITELKNNSYSQQIKNGEFKTLKETILVSPDSLKPVEASIAGNPIMQKTLGLSTLMQEKYPVSRYNEETGNFEILVGKNYPTAPGGHGVWFATIWSQIINNNYDNGHISFVGNSDALAARPDQSVVGYMEKENVGIVMLAAEREASDAKGGIFGLFKNRLTLGEIAQFEAVGQE